MAAYTWYLTNNSASIGSDLSTTDPGAEAFRSPVTGWIVSTGATLHSEWFNDVERAASTFTGTTVPDGSLDTTNGDFWVSPTILSGDFESADWNVHFGCRANTGGDTQDGRMRCRLFRGANQDGSGATEITSAHQQGGLVTNLLTSATQVSTATFNPGAFSVTNEYIFVQIAWERTGAAGMTSYDVNARIGGASSCRVVTANFVVTALPLRGTLVFAGQAPTVLVTSPLSLSPTANIAAGGNTATTVQLTPPSGKTSGDFVAGKISDDTNPLSAIDLALTKYTEVEWAIQFNSIAVVGAQYEFRLTDNGVPVSYLISTTATLAAGPEVPVARGTLAITGQLPIVLLSMFAVPAVGTLALSGQAPVAKQNHIVTPAVGSLALTGQLPEVLVQLARNPPVGALAFTGQIPASNQSYTFAMTVGTVALTGQAPLPFVQDLVAVTQGQLSFTGQVPIAKVDMFVVPTVGALAFTGQLPVKTVNLLDRQPAVGGLAFTGQAPVAYVLGVNQQSFRWRNDDGTEVTATWKSAQDANGSVTKDVPVRLRIVLDGLGDPASEQFQLEYRKVGDTAWNKVHS